MLSYTQLKHKLAARTIKHAMRTYNVKHCYRLSLETMSAGAVWEPPPMQALSPPVHTHVQLHRSLEWMRVRE